MEENKDIKNNGEVVQEEVPGDTPQDTAGEQQEQANEDARQEDEAVKVLEARMAEVNDKYIRLAAEFDNYRRRTARERLDLYRLPERISSRGCFPCSMIVKGALQVLRDSDARQGSHRRDRTNIQQIDGLSQGTWPECDRGAGQGTGYRLP